MSKITKIISLLIILITIFIVKPNNIYATEIWSNQYKIKTSDYDYTQNVDMPDNVKSATENILGAITVIGIIAGVIMIAMIGISYVIGSASEKAVDKEKLMTFAFGAFLLAGGSFIVRLIVSAVNGW